MSDRTAPLSKSAIDALNEMIDRFCPEEGSRFLRCARTRGHEGAHYDVLTQIEWTSSPSSGDKP